MHLFGIDDLLWSASVLGQLSLLFILILRGSGKAFPIFTAYIVWLTISDPLLMLVLALHHHNPADPLYYRAYFVSNVIQYAIEAAVLVEVTLEVLRPASKSLSRNILLALAAIMGILAICAFLFTAHMNSATLTHPRTYFMVNTTMAILRLAAFLLIAGFSQILGLTWKNHALQLTSGLAFYAVVTLIVEISHSNLRNGPSYHDTYVALDHLRIGGYLCALYFWCYAFAKKEAPRKEFSPQMTKILVSLSGNAKRQSAVLARTRDQ
jgi:hypothetical protein